MGCGASKCSEGSIFTSCKSEESLLKLCKERKDLIRSTRDFRFSLSASHVLYFQSLLDIGEALDGFVMEAVVAGIDSASRLRQGMSSSSTQIRSAASRMIRSSVETTSALLEPGQAFPSPIDVLETSNSFSMQNPAPHGYVQESSFRFPEYGVVQSFGSLDMPPSYCHIPGYVNRASYSTPGESAAYRSTFSYFGNEVPVGYSTGMSLGCSHYPQLNFNAIPSYSNPFDFSEIDASLGYLMEMPYGYTQYAQSNSNPAFCPPVPNAFMNYHNSFCQIKNTPSNYYAQGVFVNEMGEYSDLQELRKREGIPPLEDAAEDALEQMSEANRGVLSREQSQAVAQEGSLDKSLHQGSQIADIVSVKDHVRKDSRAPCSSVSAKGIKKHAAEKKGKLITNEGITTNGQSSSHSKEDVTLAHPKDIREIVIEIKNALNSAFIEGNQVLEILEAGKMPHLPMNSELKGYYYKALGFRAPSAIPSFQIASTLQKKLVCKAHNEAVLEGSNTENDIPWECGNLLSSLDKLCRWEKKLYAEVKHEENLRAVYEKLCKTRKRLMDHGTESGKIEAVQVKIRKLLVKIDVAIAALTTVSKSIQQIRDEELHTQISGLIHGLTSMWKSMSNCHRTQLEAIIEVKMHVPVGMSSGLRNTEKLRLSVVEWGCHFNDMVSAQRTFVKLLNLWLSKCLKEEYEATEDGVAPFSPGRIGAPMIFSTCRDWELALQTVSESRVFEAAEDLAANLQVLWEKQNASQGLMLQIEFLESWLISRNTHAEEFAEELRTSWRQLEALKAAHAMGLEQADKVATSCLKDGLAAVLRALETTCTELANTYAQIRIKRAAE